MSSSQASPPAETSEPLKDDQEFPSDLELSETATDSKDSSPSHPQPHPALSLSLLRISGSEFCYLAKSDQPGDISVCLLSFPIHLTSDD